MRNSKDYGIKKFNSIRSLNEDELHRIAECKEDKTHKKGALIFKEGVRLHGLYLITKGVVKLIKTGVDGKTQIVKLIVEGDLLGQRSLLSNEYTNLRAIALTEVETYFVPKEEILNSLKNNPSFSLDVITKLAKRLREADNGLVNMAQKSVKKRLKEALLYLQSFFGLSKDGYIKLVLSRDEYANLIGTTSASVIRELSSFKSNKNILTKGKQIKILNL